MPNYVDNIDIIDANMQTTNILLQDRGTLSLATANSSKIGDLSLLDTTEKSNLVGAINEIFGDVASISDYKILNVLDLGCDPTGAVDCSTLVNNALADSQYDGYVLYFPRGTYKVSSPINIGRNMIAVGTLYTDSTNTILNIIGHRISIIFNKIGFATDGNITSVSANNATNTSIKFDSTSANDTIYQVKLIGTFLNGGIGIEFVGGDNFYQNIYIQIDTIFAKLKCLYAHITNTDTWINEIIFDNTSFNNTDGTGTLVELDNTTGNNLMNGWRFNSCAFENSNLVFKMVRAKISMCNCRLSIYETYTSRGGVLFNISANSEVVYNGVFEFDSYFQYFVIGDMNSFIYWYGVIRRSVTEVCPYMITFLSNSNVVNTVGYNGYGYEADVTLTEDNQTINIPYSYKLTDGLIIRTGGHTGCTVNITFNDEYRALTNNNNIMSSFKPFIVELVGGTTVTLTNSNGIGGSNSKTLNPATSVEFLVTRNRVFALTGTPV